MINPNKSIIITTRMLRKIDLLYVLLISIISLFLVFDIFLNKGQPATFDGTIHITTIAQYYRGLKEGEHRITWADGFANYGMPIPLISQQTTPYLGGYLNFIFNNVLFSYNVVFLIGAFLSCLFYFIFLRIYFKPTIAFVGTLLFNFAPYRIINLYIRGDEPEFFASVFVPLVLIGIYLLIKKKSYFGFLLLTLSVGLLGLAHPFVLVVGSFLFFPYIIYCIHDEDRKKELLFLTFLSFVLGSGITAFYTLPAYVESRYFYLGLEKNHFVPNQFLGLANFFDPRWYYYYKNDTFVRGNFIKVDLLETLITLIGLIILMFTIIKRRKESLLAFAVGTSFLLIFLMTSLSNILYQRIGILNSLQFPWRVLTPFIFITPIILCIVLQKIKYRNVAIIIVIFLISALRYPQLYGKNYTVYPQSKYFFTIDNLHSTILNTVWTGKTSEYPLENQKPGIISGKGIINKKIIKNSSRYYEINALTDLRMVDYTFYFPGWQVYIDGQKTQIQYQDPNYRGVITYNVPSGNHIVILKFEDTKDRIAGYILTILSLVAAFVIFFLLRRDFQSRFVIPKVLRK